MFIRSQDRGLTKITWLYSAYSFSFDQYHNLNRMGFSVVMLKTTFHDIGGEGR